MGSGETEAQFLVSRCCSKPGVVRLHAVQCSATSATSQHAGPNVIGPYLITSTTHTRLVIGNWSLVLGGIH